MNARTDISNQRNVGSGIRELRKFPKTIPAMVGGTSIVVSLMVSALIPANVNCSSNATE